MPRNLDDRDIPSDEFFMQLDLEISASKDPFEVLERAFSQDILAPEEEIEDFNFQEILHGYLSFLRNSVATLKFLKVHDGENSLFTELVKIADYLRIQILALSFSKRGRNKKITSAHIDMMIGVLAEEWQEKMTLLSASLRTEISLLVPVTISEAISFLEAERRPSAGK